MTDSPPPRVSVLLSVCNAEDFLAEALDSVLAQGFTDFELLAHDDGSTDGSWTILQGCAARDDRVRISRGENMGVGAVPNLLLTRARGAYIARMDADDVCLPDRFARQVAFLDAHPEHVAIGGSTLTIDAEGRPILRAIAPPDHATIDARNLRGIASIEHPTAMIRRDALDRIGGYDASLRNCEDLDLWLRLAEVGLLANLPDIVLKYRVHDKSISGTRRQEQEEMTRRVCMRAAARRGVETTIDYKGWRMGESRASRLEFYLTYGWQAWGAGFRETWRHYAMRALRTAPFSGRAWKLLIFGALRRPAAAAPS